MSRPVTPGESGRSRMADLSSVSAERARRLLLAAAAAVPFDAADHAAKLDRVYAEAQRQAAPQPPDPPDRSDYTAAVRMEGLRVETVCTP